MKELSTSMESAQAVAGGRETGTASVARLAAAGRSVEAAAAALTQEGGPQPAFVADVLEVVLNDAADAYIASIADGKIADAARYQEAMGLTQVAGDYLAVHERLLANANASRLQAAQAAMAQIRRAYPTATPPEPPVLAPGALLGLTSQVQLALSRMG
jgi:hypothetical protein